VAGALAGVENGPQTSEKGLSTMSDTSTPPPLELDCRGLLCPLPILKTRQALAPLASGTLLKMVSSDPASVPDMAAFSRRSGHELVDQSWNQGEYTFLIRRK